MPANSDYQLSGQNDGSNDLPSGHDDPNHLIDAVLGGLVPPDPVVPPNPVQEAAGFADDVIDALVPPNPIVPPNPVQETLLLLNEFGTGAVPPNPVQEPTSDWLFV
jgi:hypothetical protein